MQLDLFSSPPRRRARNLDQILKDAIIWGHLDGHLRPCCRKYHDGSVGEE